MRANLRKAAWMQAIATAVLTAGVATSLVVVLRRPFDADTLAIQVEALQSHAAEAALLAALQRADQLAPGFTGEHAAQLAESVQRTQDALAGKDADPALASQLASARQLGASLHARLEAWSADGGLARSRQFGFEALARQLGALHSQLQPGS